MMKIDKEQLKRIVERHMLVPGQCVTEVIVGQAAAKVTAGNRWWLVRPFEAAPNFDKSQGYRLYDIESSVRTFPGAQSQGVAALPDGATFLLDDEENFRSFFRQAHTILEPLELASLLASYQSGAEGNESVVVQIEELTGLLTEEQLAGISELTLPQVTTQPDGSLMIRFTTVYLAPAPPDYVIRVNLNLWQVNATTGGELEWSVQQIARNLDSPRYAPG